MSSDLKTKEELTNEILKHTLIEIQRSGAGRFNVDPRNCNATIQPMTVLNVEFDLINQHKSGMSASQRIKVTNLHKALHSPTPKPKVKDLI